MTQFQKDYAGFQAGAKRLEVAMRGIPDRVLVYAQIHEFVLHELGVSAKEFYTTPEILVPGCLEIQQKYGIDVAFIDYDVPGAKVITFEKRPVEAAVAQELGLSVSTPVYYVRRLRLINQEPVMLERFTMPAHRFPGLENFDLSGRSAYQIFEKEYGILVVRARQSLEPVAATEYEAELLGVKSGTPLMLERRLAFDQDDQPVEYGKDLYRGDRFRFVTEMAPLEL